ncbi:hypothetical protein [Paenibacillus senegalensis]|uniref:hypothetical protein n=1 Tax=Paenibacillus senegalensis TaxID=1465766 RepID=UPI000288645E|nr:hypothetical protein [Paenibacillus senegalensis]
MSRKWERMVEKNQQKLYKQRQKQGKSTSLTSSSIEQTKRYLGRTWMLPLFLIGFSLCFTVLFYDFYEGDASYWFISIAYFLLGVFIYLVRRPSLTIGKKFVMSRRFAGDKRVEAGDIQEITLLKGYVIIQFKGRMSRWVFSKFMHRMPIEEIAEELKEFAKRNGVTLNDTPSVKS